MAKQSLNDIDRNGVLELMKQDAQVVDVLGPDDYRKSHIPGAINLPLGKIDRSLAGRWKWDQTIILYCYDYQ